MRFFYDQRMDRIIIVEQNSCGCCKHNIIKTWGRGFYMASSISFNSQDEIEQYLKTYVELK